jgi:PAS domain S-box-containing protein
MANHLIENSVRNLFSRQKLLEAFFDCIPELVYCRDIHGKIVYVNQALADIFGYPKIHFEGKTVAHNAPNSIAQLMTDDVDVMNSGKPKSNVLLSYHTREGERRAQISKVPLADENGRVAGLIGFATDITEQHKIQKALRTSEEKYRNFFKTSRDCVFITSMEGKTREFNDASLEMFGYDRKEDLLTVSVLDLYEDIEQRKEFTEKLAKEGLVHRYPVRMKRKDGSIIECLVTAMPVKDANGEITAYQGIIQDISALKRAEDERKALADELQQAQKLEAVIALAGGVSHDFNNLLFGIMGNVELAQKTANGPQINQLTRAMNSCMEAKKLIHRFLELTASAPSFLKPHPIADVIQNVINARVSSDTHFFYETCIPGGLYHVPYVYDQMYQVMGNLISNAEQAMPGGGTVTVSIENWICRKNYFSGTLALVHGNYVKIMVSDTGVGIPEDKLKKIFDPYFSTRQRSSSKGRGLGLTIVYATIKRHKGEISVDSVPGVGTTLSIYLPAFKGSH